MLIPVGSWEDWHMECTVDVTDIAVVDNVRYNELLPKIGNDPEETLKRLTLQSVAELDERKNSFFKRYYNTSEISKYLVNATGLFYDCAP
uniref:Uncharacterized protein n=1 Tax=Oryza punctata TaxID=4537 RepID=A0A0E0JKP9_ORYPU